MPFERSSHERRYTCIDNSPLQDERLSWAARGLLAYMLSMPDDWSFYFEELCKHSTDGKTATRTALDKLERAGYVTRNHPKRKDGTFERWVWTVREVPVSENQTVVPVSENQTVVPVSEKPNADFPNADNPPLQSTYRQNTHIQTAAWKDEEDVVLPPCMGRTFSGCSFSDIGGGRHSTLKGAVEASLACRSFRCSPDAFLAKVRTLCGGCSGEHVEDVDECSAVILDAIEKATAADPWGLTRTKLEQDRRNR